MSNKKTQNGKNGIWEIPSLHGPAGQFVHIVIALSGEEACKVLARTRAIQKIQPKHPEFDPDSLKAQHYILQGAIFYLERGPVKIGETDAEPGIVEINRAKEIAPEGSILH